MAARKKSTGPTPYTFLSGWVQDRNIIRVTAQIDELEAAESTETQRMKWERSGPKWSAFSVDFRQVRIVTIQQPDGLYLFTIGPQGDVSAGHLQSGWEEEVDPGPEGPTGRGDIVDLRVIEGKVYCAGMSRQVYQRVGKNDWKHIDAGVVLPLGDISVAGFNSIDGAGKLLIAVGYNGEIWCRKGTRWTQMSSPTNAILHWIRVLEPDHAFCSGQKGVLLEWDGNLWKAIDLGDMEEDIWSIEWFKGHLYMAADERLLRLSSSYKLEEVKGVPDKNSETLELHANDGVLLATGSKHVWITEDGKKWHDITP
jgi:hypothetical protein